MWLILYTLCSLYKVTQHKRNQMKATKNKQRRKNLPAVAQETELVSSRKHKVRMTRMLHLPLMSLCDETEALMATPDLFEQWKMESQCNNTSGTEMQRFGKQAVPWRGCGWRVAAAELHRSGNFHTIPSLFYQQTHSNSSYTCDCTKRQLMWRQVSILSQVPLMKSHKTGENAT